MVVWDYYDKVDITPDRESHQSGTRTYITNPTWFVEPVDGEKIERDTRQSAVALATLFEQLERVKIIEQHEDAVPTKVAIEGMPAIATYLRGVHQMSKDQIAEELEVTESTVETYITRFRPHTKS